MFRFLVTKLKTIKKVTTSARATKIKDRGSAPQLDISHEMKGMPGV